MLTKSLHTVTAVSRVAVKAGTIRPLRLPTAPIVVVTPEQLAQLQADPTMLASINATKKLLEAK